MNLKYPHHPGGKDPSHKELPKRWRRCPLPPTNTLPIPHRRSTVERTSLKKWRKQAWWSPKVGIKNPNLHLCGMYRFEETAGISVSGMWDIRVMELGSDYWSVDCGCSDFGKEITRFLVLQILGVWEDILLADGLGFQGHILEFLLHCESFRCTLSVSGRVLISKAGFVKFVWCRERHGIMAWDSRFEWETVCWIDSHIFQSQRGSERGTVNGYPSGAFLLVFIQGSDGWICT